MKKTLFALAAAAAVGSAHAGPFYVNPGFDGGFATDGNTITAEVAELGITGTRATSFYLGDPAVVGTKVVDTNIASIMTGYGFTPTAAGTTYTTIGGTNVVYKAVGTPGDRNVDALNLVDGTSTDLEGFTNGQTVPYTFTGFWGLTFDYVLNGEITATGISYTSGYFNVFFNSAAGIEQVLKLNLIGSTLNVANLDLMGEITYDFDGNGLDDDASSLAKNLFIDSASGKTFYELWENGTGGLDPVKVSWALDTNVNPPVPTLNSLVSLNGGQGPLVRQTTLDSSIVFDVPEPFSLALVGIGLLGLGLTRRQKAQA